MEEPNKIVQLMASVGSIQKDKTNDFHHYRYASAAAVLGKVQQAMIELGLYCTVNFVMLEPRDGVTIVNCGVSVFDGHTLLITGSAFGSGSDKGDKAVMKAQTAALKYAWMSMLCIPTEDDPEADSSTDARTSAPVKAPVSAPSAALAAVESVVVKVVEDLAPRDGKKPWKIETDQGIFQTFDEKQARAIGSGAIVVYRKTKFGNDIVEVKPAAEGKDE